MRHRSPEINDLRFVGSSIRYILIGLSGIALVWVLVPCLYLCVWAIWGTGQRDHLGPPSFQWFDVLIKDSGWRSAIGVSLGYAILCATTTCCLIAFFAYSNHFAKRWLEFLGGCLLLAVLLTPSVSLALAYKYVSGCWQIPPDLTYAVGNTLLLLPVAYAIFEAGQSQVSRERLQAGIVLGATHFRNFLYVFLPQVWRPLLTAYVLCFLTSLDESVFAVTLFDTPPFPVTKLLWDLSTTDISPLPAAAVLTLAALSGLLFWVAAYVFHTIRTQIKKRRKHATLF